MSAHEPHGNVEVVADPIADPGLSPHLPRPTDVDPAKEKRAERQVATLFGLSAVASILFAVAYFTFAIGGKSRPHFGLRCISRRPRAQPRRRLAWHRHWRHLVGPQAHG